MFFLADSYYTEYRVAVPTGPFPRGHANHGAHVCSAWGSLFRKTEVFVQPQQNYLSLYGHSVDYFEPSTVFRARERQNATHGYERETCALLSSKLVSMAYVGTQRGPRSLFPRLRSALNST